MKEHTCAIIVTGAAVREEEIMKRVRSAVADGCTHFLSCMEYGLGLSVAQTVLSLRDQGAHLTLECVIPYEEYTTVWDEASREQYFDILRRCDKETLLQRHYEPDCEIKGREYLLHNAEKVLAI